MVGIAISKKDAMYGWTAGGAWPLVRPFSKCREDDATDVDHTSSNPPQKAISPGCEDVIRDQS